MTIATSEERNWAVACHLASLTAYIGVPLGHVLGPLVVWLIKKDQSSFVDVVGKEALNYNLSLTIWLILSAVLVLCFVGVIGLVALVIMDLIVTVLAAMAASRGEIYHYPLTIRFIT